MKAVRLTFHKGYRHKDGTPYNPKHNDRNGFTKPKSAKNNVYENYAALTWGGETFFDSEMACYKACFTPYVKNHNAKRKRERHPERCIDIKQYYEKHPPEETLFYLGKMDNNVGSDALLEVFHEYCDWLNSNCVDNIKGCGVELLNAALHTDENGAVHVQSRQMYYYTDKDGNFQISQNKALAGLGYERPDMTRETSKTNNAKMTFTAVCREKLIEIAKSRGVELITEPLPKKDVGKTLAQYIADEKLRVKTENAKQAIQAEREKLCVETENAEQELAKHEKAIENAYDELGTAIKKSRAEIQENELIKRDLRQEIDDMKEYHAWKRAKSDEQAEQEAQRVREEREEIKREFLEQQETNNEIIGLNDLDLRDFDDEEEEHVQETVQNTSETHETVSEYLDTPKQPKPRKTQNTTRNDETVKSADDDWDLGL